MPLLCLILGTLLGWWAHKARVAIDDVRSDRRKLAEHRQARSQGLLVALGLAVLVVVGAYDLLLR